MCELRQNARQKLTKISKVTQVPISTIFDKLKMFEQEIIKKNTVLLDFERLGFNARANICIKVPREHKEELRKYLQNHDNVNSLYKTTNNFDFITETVFRNLQDMQLFIEKIESKFDIEKEVFYLVEDIKREAFLSNPFLTGI